MSVKFAITIDTEEDQWGGYHCESNTVENINALLSLQKIFDKHNAVPTYLVNWPVISGHKSSQIIKKLCNEHNCEIGTHCHPWNTPPFGETINDENSMMCNLSYEIVEKKLSCLHEKIVKKINVEPTSFRAGRWGFDSKVAKCIQSLGYKVDSSVTPFVDWTIYGGPDFSDASPAQYRFEASDIFRHRTDGTLLEVPVSIGFLQKDFVASHRVRSALKKSRLRKLRLLGFFDRIGLLNHRWMSPELSSADDMIKLSDKLILNGHTVLNFTFHSTSLLPGKSPFVQSQDDLKIFLRRIETVITCCAERNYEFISLSSLL